MKKVDRAPADVPRPSLTPADDGGNEARRQVRDLAAVLALPAVWRTFEPERTVSSLVEVLAGLLRADFVYAGVVDRNRPLRATAMYPRGAALASLRQQLEALERDDDDAAAVQELARIDEGMAPSGMRVWMVTPRGQHERWHVVAGSKRPDFPTALERFLMEAAADQAAISVEKSLLIDAERTARADAEAANQAKSAFLASMSHELRTPLNAISGYVELMQMRIHGPLTGKQEEDLARVRRSAQHLLGLINDILNFAKIEAGHIDVRVADVNARELLATLRDWIDPQLRARSLDFEYVLPASHLTARADPERLRQILLNLLSNAVKFTAPGGRIAVFCTTSAGEVAVHVRDTGCGIPAAKLDRIFEPFVQGDRSFARTTDGVGLGLTISRELARAMGGDLTVESTEGVGSTFTLRLLTKGA